MIDRVFDVLKDGEKYELCDLCSATDFSMRKVEFIMNFLEQHGFVKSHVIGGRRVFIIDVMVKRFLEHLEHLEAGQA